jgi:hypothetical protein
VILKTLSPGVIYIFYDLDIYGNAYFHNAFISSTQYEDLNFALNSYNQAEKYLQNKNPDLYYNRAIVQSYLENYNEAFSDFNIAHIDESLKADSLANNILVFVLEMCKLIKNKCTIKPKKLLQILNTIPTNINPGIGFTLCSIDTIAIGENKSKVLSAKSVQAVTKNFEVPL